MKNKRVAVNISTNGHNCEGKFFEELTSYIESGYHVEGGIRSISTGNNGGGLIKTRHFALLVKEVEQNKPNS